MPVLYCKVANINPVGVKCHYFRGLANRQELMSTEIFYLITCLSNDTMYKKKHKRKERNKKKAELYALHSKIKPKKQHLSVLLIQRV